MASKHYYWQNLADELVSRKIGSSEVVTFKNLPHNPYEILQQTSHRYAEKTAIVDADHTAYTYGELIHLTDKFAGYLYDAYNIQRGEHVGILLQTSVEYCITFFALCKLGAVTVPLPVKYRQNEIVALASKANIRVILCEGHQVEWFPKDKYITISTDRQTGGFAFRSLPDIVPDTDARGRLEDPVILMFTSGTTSQSKGALLKNYNIMHAIVAYQKTLGITNHDRTILATPIYNITGLVAILGLFIYVGGTLYLHRKFNPEQVLQCIIENDVTFLHASPTVFSMLLDYRNDYPHIPSINSFACGSSNMPAENIIRLKQWMPEADFHTVYGLTETSSPAAIFPTGAAESPYIGSSGVPIPGLEVKIIDEDESTLTHNKIGEVAVRGAVVLECYYIGGEGSYTKDGWFKTGDLGYLNKDGYLYIVDRKKDMVNRGGEKICCFDVENAMHSISGIIEAAVVGIPHPVYGEQPVAVVRLESGYSLTEDQIKEALLPKLTKYKIPTQIRFVDSMIKTPNGKIDKRGIRASFHSLPMYSVTTKEDINC